MKYFLLSLLFSFYTIIVLARDTVLVDEIKISIPVISIINDADGNVFIHTKKMIYKFEDNQLKFFKNCDAPSAKYAVVTSISSPRSERRILPLIIYFSFCIN